MGCLVYLAMWLLFLALPFSLKGLLALYAMYRIVKSFFKEK